MKMLINKKEVRKQLLEINKGWGGKSTRVAKTVLEEINKSVMRNIVSIGMEGFASRSRKS
jgi:hypothetical protein